ncbi:MAG TPA: hypothetical protein VGV35_21035, partial [Bryobacteraceae bacterium]|nr:hypothetical protein [Bryobacteraceae bacterium]
MSSLRGMGSNWGRATICSASRAVLLGAIAWSAFAQAPQLYSRSVFNAASYTPAGIPGGAIARGSIFSLFGARLGPTPPVSSNSFPLPAALGGITINVIQGGTSVSAIPLYVSDGQINAIMPSNAPLGMASIQVASGNVRSNMLPVRIANNAFGIFTALGIGSGPGVMQNFITGANQPVNAPTVTAQNGQTITLYGTGLGPVTGGDNVAPPAGNLPVKVEVFVGGVSAAVAYSGRSPCCAGLDQIVFQVPDKTPSGCWVPLYVRTGGTAVSNFVTMAINASPSTCSTDVLPRANDILVNGGRFGAAVTLRATTRQDVAVKAPVDVTADYHFSFGFQDKATTFPFNPGIAAPPSGTCTFYTLSGDILAGDPLPGLAPAALPLDFGGAFMLTGPKGTKTLSSTFTGGIAGYLGGQISNGILGSTLFLDPGAYTVKGLGGIDVGSFSAAYNIPQPLSWT